MSTCCEHLSRLPRFEVSVNDALISSVAKATRESRHRMSTIMFVTRYPSSNGMDEVQKRRCRKLVAIARSVHSQIRKLYREL